MKYAEPRLAQEFLETPQQLQQHLRSVDTWLVGQGWPELFLTSVGRTDEDSERIYTPYAEKLVTQLQAGLVRGEKELALARTLAGMSPEGRRAWARGRFSWHRALCAVDIRNRVYSRAQRKELMNRLRNGTNSSQWEILEHDVGRGDHIHVAYRDFSRRQRLPTT